MAVLCKKHWMDHHFYTAYFILRIKAMPNMAKLLCINCASTQIWCCLMAGFSFYISIRRMSGSLGQSTTTMTIYWSCDEVHQIHKGGEYTKGGVGWGGGGCCCQNHYPITCYLVLPPIFKFSEISSIIYVFHHKMVSISVVYIGSNHVDVSAVSKLE
jgi:hypothetical protein